MAKSEGNVVYLSDSTERGFHPLALRYLFLTSHYRTPASFSWEALDSAQKALAKLIALRLSLRDVVPGSVSRPWQRKFITRINDDLDTPGGLAVLWDMIKSKRLTPGDLLATLLDFDKVFGLHLTEPDEQAVALAQAGMQEEVNLDSLPEDVRAMVQERETARGRKDWGHADALRVRIEHAGYGIKDMSEGTRIHKK